MCRHKHTWSCALCSSLDRLSDDITSIIDQVRVNQDSSQHSAELESMSACMERVGGQMLRYVKHAARAVWQHARIADAMIKVARTPTLRGSILFIDLDHKQKVLGYVQSFLA